MNMQTIFQVLLVLTTGLASGRENRWEEAIRLMEAADARKPPPKAAIMLVGSSSIQRWSSLGKDFSGWPVINRGFGGSMIADISHYADRIILPLRPKVILMYAGGNDLHRGRTPEQVTDDFRVFVEKIHSVPPETRIVFLSLKPTRQRWSEIEQVKAANRLIEGFTRSDARLSFINGFDAFLDAESQPRKDLLAKDGLHLKARGYATWCSIIKPELVRLSPPAMPGAADGEHNESITKRMEGDIQP